MSNKMKRVKLTHEQHVVLAKQLAEASEALQDAYFTFVQPAFGKTHPASKPLLRVIRTMVAVRRELDTEYHKVTSNDQFISKGHVYYKVKGGK